MNIHRIPRELLATFVPLNALAQDRLDYLLEGHAIEHLERGAVVFREGETDGQAIFLLSGVLALENSAGDSRHLSAGDVESWYAVAPGQPRAWTATAAAPVNLFRLDSEVLDEVLSWDQAMDGLLETLAAERPHEDQEWLARLLCSRLFFRVPPGNIRELLARMRPEQHRAGEVVIRQGEAADACYFIREGVVDVYVDTPEGPRTVAVLEAGRYFGEEGLLTEGPRNATVQMETDGILMRLEKHDFDELLKAPVVETLSFEEAREQVRHRGAAWLDVRLPEEYDTGRLPAAIAMPLQSLRVKQRLLPRDKTYIAYCDTGKRSTAAAFLLRDAGFEVYVLQGGVQAMGPELREAHLS